MIRLLLVLLAGCPILATVASSQGGVPGERSLLAGAERGVSSLRLDRLPSPSHHAPLVAGSQTAFPAIEPTWIYITSLNWKRAPRGFHVSSSSATIAILYPEGQYFEAAVVLIKTDKGVALTDGGARVLSTGTWSRTDDKVIRIESRVVFRNPPSEGHKLPEPSNTDTCGLEGQSPTHLAQRIHCKAMILSPSHLNLDLAGLQRMAADAFEASPKQ